MSDTQTATWLARDLPVLRAVERLDLTGHGPHDITTLAQQTGLRTTEVDPALEVLESLRAIRVTREGMAPRVEHLTAIGSTMLAMQAENELG